MSPILHTLSASDDQIRLQLDHARYPFLSSLALGCMDQEGETPHQNYRRQSPNLTLDARADVQVVGTVLLLGFQLVLYGLVLSTVCGTLWQIRPICR